jgi:protein O-GlcNAc transferase
MPDKRTKPARPAPPSQGQQAQGLNIQQALDLALPHHSAGHLDQAERIYRRILQTDTHQPAALYLLGAIALQVGQIDAAVELVNEAVASKPDFV